MDITLTLSQTRWTTTTTAVDDSSPPSATPVEDDGDPSALSAPDGDGSAPTSPLGQALAQALQSQGLSLDDSTDPNGSAGDGDAFMDSLFGALNQQAPATDGPSGGGSLSGSLSQLITQVSQSNAPADLQQAFDQWMSTTQGQGDTPTLGDVLGALQSQVGYGDDTGLSALSNRVDTQA